MPSSVAHRKFEQRNDSSQCVLAWPNGLLQILSDHKSLEVFGSVIASLVDTIQEMYSEYSSSTFSVRG